MVPDPSITEFSARFDAAYFSMLEGFLRSPFVLGLSNVEADEPDTSEGVLMFDGGGRTP